MQVINGRSNLATDPIRNFRFLVKFLPHDQRNKALNFQPTIGFTSVSGLVVNTESIPYREGGYNTSVHQIPGQSSFSPITMQRGVVLGSRQHFDWMRQLFRVVNGVGTDAAGALGVVAKDFRCDLEIAVLQHPAAGSAVKGSVHEAINSMDDVSAMRFKVYNAWPTSVAYSDLNAGDNALLVEQMTLVHEGWDAAWAPKPGQGAPMFQY